MKPDQDDDGVANRTTRIFQRGDQRFEIKILGENSPKVNMQNGRYRRSKRWYMCVNVGEVIVLFEANTNRETSEVYTVATMVSSWVPIHIAKLSAD